MNASLHREIVAEIAATLEFLKFDAGPKGHDLYEAYEHQVLIPALMRLRAAAGRSGLYAVAAGGNPTVWPPTIQKAMYATNRKLEESKAKQPSPPPRRLWY